MCKAEQPQSQSSGWEMLRQGPGSSWDGIGLLCRLILYFPGFGTSYLYWTLYFNLFRKQNSKLSFRGCCSPMRAPQPSFHVGHERVKMSLFLALTSPKRLGALNSHCRVLLGLNLPLLASRKPGLARQSCSPYPGTSRCRCCPGAAPPEGLEQRGGKCL